MPRGSTPRLRGGAKKPSTSAADRDAARLARLKKASVAVDEIEELSITAKDLIRDAVKTGDDELIEAIRKDVATWKEIIEDDGGTR